MTKEEAYDEQIAPLMGQIIAICKEHRINLHATFELDRDVEGGPLTCDTHLELDLPVFLPLELMGYAMNARDNFDSFVMAVMRRARQTGHQSAVLKVLGVPAVPDEQHTPPT